MNVYVGEDVIVDYFIYYTTHRIQKEKEKNQSQQKGQSEYSILSTTSYLPKVLWAIISSVH